MEPSVFAFRAQPTSLEAHGCAMPGPQHGSPVDPCSTQEFQETLVCSVA